MTYVLPAQHFIGKEGMGFFLNGCYAWYDLLPSNEMQYVRVIKKHLFLKCLLQLPAKDAAGITVK